MRGQDTTYLGLCIISPITDMPTRTIVLGSGRLATRNPTKPFSSAGPPTQQRFVESKKTEVSYQLPPRTPRAANLNRSPN